MSPATIKKSKKAQIRILCKEGMHLRCAEKVIDLLRQFKSQVKVSDGKAVVDVRRPIDLLIFEAPRGATLEIETVGEDADEAAQKIEAYFGNEDNFQNHE